MLLNNHITIDIYNQDNKISTYDFNVIVNYFVKEFSKLNINRTIKTHDNVIFLSDNNLIITFYIPLNMSYISIDVMYRNIDIDDKLINIISEYFKDEKMHIQKINRLCLLNKESNLNNENKIEYDILSLCF